MTRRLLAAAAAALALTACSTPAPEPSPEPSDSLTEAYVDTTDRRTYTLTVTTGRRCGEQVCAVQTVLHATGDFTRTDSKTGPTSGTVDPRITTLAGRALADNLDVLTATPTPERTCSGDVTTYQLQVNDGRDTAAHTISTCAYDLTGDEAAAVLSEVDRILAAVPTA